MKSFLSLSLVLIALAVGAATYNRWPQPVIQVSGKPDAATKARFNDAYGQLPLSFEANAGQADPRVDFISRGSGYTLFLTPREAVLTLRAPAPAKADAVLLMKFAGSEAKPRGVGHEELPGKVNYFTGKDPKNWRTGISTYAKVAYQNLYPGVDLVYYGNQRQLEYDFVVHPGTDPNVIALQFEGADQLKVDTDGELVLHARGGEVRQRKPFIYQEVDGVRREVAGSYKLKDTTTVGFELADYDTSRPLVIDPVLVYSTFLGGVNVESGNDITIDASGNAYVTGSTQQIGPSTFPTTAGAFDTTHNGSDDAFVTKLNATGSALIYSTFLGGSELDGAAAIAIDSAGNAYVTGSTASPDFPVTSGAFDTTFNGDRDAFVTKLDPSGSALVYSTFIGGFESDLGASIAVDTSGNAYAAGVALSSSYPTTPGAFDTVHNNQDIFEIFVTKLNPAGSALVYSTFLGGSGGSSDPAIALDASGFVYVTGTASSADFPTTAGAFDTTFNDSEAFVTKVNQSGSALIYSTFLGGSNRESGNGIALDASGNAYVTGITTSADFPATAGAFDTTYNGDFDGFVTKLNASGSALVYSTFLGDVNFDSSNDIAVDTSGSVYVIGTTGSPNFPTTVDAFDTTYNGGPFDVFVTQLNPAGSAPLVYSTFLGGSGNPQETGIGDDHGAGIALDTSGNFYVIGSTRSANFPTTAGAFDTTFNGVQDAFVAKFSAAVLSTARCEITTGGWIVAANGDRATFGGHVKANKNGETEGQQVYQDHGPAQRLKMHSINVLAVVCDGTTRASIFGQATIDGSGVVNYRIDVQDLGGPGKGQDTYQLIVDGYDSGPQILGGGNIQIRR